MSPRSLFLLSVLLPFLSAQDAGAQVSRSATISGKEQWTRVGDSFHTFIKEGYELKAVAQQHDVKGGDPPTTMTIYYLQKGAAIVKCYETNLATAPGHLDMGATINLPWPYCAALIEPNGFRVSYSHGKG